MSADAEETGVPMPLEVNPFEPLHSTVGNLPESEPPPLGTYRRAVGEAFKSYFREAKALLQGRYAWASCPENGRFLTQGPVMILICADAIFVRFDHEPDEAACVIT